MAECVLTRLSRGGVKLLIDDIECKEKEVILESIIGDLYINDIPISNMTRTNIITYKDAIHLIGGSINTSISFTHYIYHDSEYTALSKLPTNFGAENPGLVIYKDKLYAIGGTVNTYGPVISRIIYEYNDTDDTWSDVIHLPFDWEAYGGEMNYTIHNDEIHIIRGRTSGTYNYHYKWDGVSWTSVSTLPNDYVYSIGSFNNELYIIRNSSDTTVTGSLMKLNNTSWKYVSNFPDRTKYGSAGALIVYDNKLYSMGSSTFVLNDENKIELVRKHTIFGSGSSNPVVYKNSIYQYRYNSASSSTATCLCIINHTFLNKQ